MSKNKKTIPIFFATDDNYVPFLAVSMQSMLSNANKEYMYKIYILNNGLKESNIEKLNKYNCEYVTVEYVNVASRMESVSESLHTRDYYSKSTYYRLFIPKMFPEYSKALYLDCDITVVGDISEFYNTDIKNNLVGAITDEAVSNVAPFIDYVERALGISYKNYFNAGILIMNLEELRKMDFENVFIGLLGRYKFTVAQDQDYLNVICKDRVYYVNKQWNKMPIEDKTFHDSDLRLIHYNLNDKPWKFDNVLYEEYFWRYAKETDFYDEIIAFKNNYSDEKKLKDQEGGKRLLLLAAAEADSDSNYYNLYVKKNEKMDVDLMDAMFDSDGLLATNESAIDIGEKSGEGCLQG